MMIDKIVKHYNPRNQKSKVVNFSVVLLIVACRKKNMLELRSSLDARFKAIKLYGIDVTIDSILIFGYASATNDN
jgi:hypothetical protein